MADVTALFKALDSALQGVAHQHFRSQVNNLCERLVLRMRQYDRSRQLNAGVTPVHPQALPAIEWGRASAQAELAGQVVGLRQALCLLLGYDPDTESGKEDAADRYVMEWWDRHHAEEEWDLGG